MLGSPSFPVQLKELANIYKEQMSEIIFDESTLESMVKEYVTDVLTMLKAGTPVYVTRTATATPVLTASMAPTTQAPMVPASVAPQPQQPALKAAPQELLNQPHGPHVPTMSPSELQEYMLFKKFQEMHLKSQVTPCLLYTLTLPTILRV